MHTPHAYEPLLVGWITNASSKITTASNRPYNDGTHAHDQPLVAWIVGWVGLDYDGPEGDEGEQLLPSLCLTHRSASSNLRDDPLFSGISFPNLTGWAARISCLLGLS
jgi:hypothetical protein